MSGLWKATSWLDRLIVVSVLALACGGLWWNASRPSSARVVIEQDGEVKFLAPLAENVRASIDGPLGETVIAIEDGGVRVTAASCPHRLCMAMGTVKQQGEVIACLPNRVLVRVVGGAREKGYDFLSQ